MRKWLPSLLLPLMLLQPSALAQSSTPPGASGQAAVSVAQPNSIALVPMKGTEQLQLQLVNCNSWLDCGLAQLLLPKSALINDRQLQFDNPSTVPANILNSAIVIQGDFTGYQLTPAITLPQGARSLPPNQISSIPLTLNRTVMPPDHYSGGIYLILSDAERVVIPTDISVRSSPLLPLIVLLFGVILGRLLKYMQERGEPQSKSLREVYRLQEDIAIAALEDQEKQILSNMVSDVKLLVSREQLQDVPVQLQAIRDRLATLIKLEALENQLNQQARTFPTDVDVFTVKIRKARRLVADKKDAEAKQLLEELSSEFENIGTRGGEDATVEASKRSLLDVAIAADRLTQPTKVAKTSRFNQFQQFLIRLSGVSDQVRAEATFWIVRPLLSLILLVGLSAAGIGSLYVEKGATFGARPFTDYLGLILWGLSADVASRSLSSLQGSKEP